MLRLQQPNEKKKEIVPDQVQLLLKKDPERVWCVRMPNPPSLSRGGGSGSGGGFVVVRRALWSKRCDHGDSVVTSASRPTIQGNCYEIWARSLPWRGVSPVSVAISVAAGARLSIPKQAPHSIQEVMALTQRTDPSTRPTMREIVRKLKGLKRKKREWNQEKVADSEERVEYGPPPADPRKAFRDYDDYDVPGRESGDESTRAHIRIDSQSVPEEAVDQDDYVGLTPDLQARLQQVLQEEEARERKDAKTGVAIQEAEKANDNEEEKEKKKKKKQKRKKKKKKPAPIK